MNNSEIVSPQEGIDTHQQFTEAVATAESFEALYEAFDTFAPIKLESGVVLSADELIEACESIRSGQAFANNVTRMFGLREKVVELYGHELVSQTKSLDELLTAIDIIVATTRQSVASATNGEIDTVELKATIAYAMQKKLDITFITQTFGIRSKVAELRKLS